MSENEDISSSERVKGDEYVLKKALETYFLNCFGNRL